MSRSIPVTVTLRIQRETRDMLKFAADADHRSMANLIEVLILRHCETAGISVSPKRTTKKKSA